MIPKVGHGWGKVDGCQLLLTLYLDRPVRLSPRYWGSLTFASYWLAFRHCILRDPKAG
jgi:hypothetical protein